MSKQKVGVHQLSAPVGPANDPLAVNHQEDVDKVRWWLKLAAKSLRNRKYNPGGSTGDGVDNQLIACIAAFQRRFSPRPDGRVDPGGKTLYKLLLPTLGKGPFFPFASLPKLSWKESYRKFGARRSKGKRIHAGSDLYFPKGTLIYAVDQGLVVKGPVEFYLGADELCIYHNLLNVTIRYGEILKGSTKLRPGMTVEAGEPIARVGKMRGITNTMLHLEVYAGRVVPRAVYGSRGKMGTLNGKQVPYNRLKSLTNPEPYLDRWKSNCPSMAFHSQRQKTTPPASTAKATVTTGKK